MSSPIYFVEVIEVNAERMSCIVSALPAILGQGDRYDFTPSPSLAVAFLWEPWDDMRRGMAASSNSTIIDANISCAMSFSTSKFCSRRLS